MRRDATISLGNDTRFARAAAGWTPPAVGAVARRTMRARSGRRAFTLVELLVAAGITALLAGFIVVIVRNISIVSTRASNRLGTDAQARIVLDQIQLDLQGALYRDDGNVWLAADVLNNSNGNTGTPWQIAMRNAKPSGGPSLQMTAPNLANARFGAAGVWLRFFTTSRGTNVAATPATISSPVAVGYQIVRRFTATNPTSMNTAYLLHRVEVRPATAGGRIGVLEAGYNITSANYTTSSSNTNNGSITGDPRTIQVVSTNPRNLDAVIADNVVDFGVRCYVRDQTVPGGLRLTFPATSTGTLSNASNARLRGTLPSATPLDQWGSAQPFPDVVDVMVRILTDEGAALIANIEKNQTPALTVPVKYLNAQEWWWGLAQENSRVYTRRIVLNSKST